MNAARRKRIADAQALMDQARAILEEVAQDEEAAFENLPEGLQAGDRGQDMADKASSSPTRPRTLKPSAAPSTK